MDRVEFINRTCMDDQIRKSVLELFWDQYMLVCELSDEIEQVVPLPITIGQGKIAFQLIYSDLNGVTRLKQVIDSNNCFVIYERCFMVTYWEDTDPKVITISIE